MTISQDPPLAAGGEAATSNSASQRGKENGVVEGVDSNGGNGGVKGTNGDVNGVENGGKKKKLHGRAFWESIGSPKYIVAPMVDQSEFAWRMLTRTFMSEKSDTLLAYTPMFHARMFAETPKFRDVHFQPLRGSLISPSTATSNWNSNTSPTNTNPTSKPRVQDVFLDGNPSIDRPLFVQFCANNPHEFFNAAQYVQGYCDAVDLNLGCPQGIARRGNYGAFLQEDISLICSLISKLHLELDVPVTAKIRVLETKEETLEYAKKIVEAGVSVLTVHGRKRDMKGHKTGLADWNIIRFLREQIPKEVVMFANGNILVKEDIERCLKETGVDGVMSAEGNLYDPSIFGEVPREGEEGREFWRGNGREEDGKEGKGGWRMDAVMRRYMDIIHKYVLETDPPVRKPLWIPSDGSIVPPPPPTTTSIENGNREEANAEENSEPPHKKLKLTSTPQPSTKPKQQKTKGTRKEKVTSPNLVAMQPHLFRLLRPLVKRHHNVRDALAKSRAGDMEAFEHVLSLVEEVCREGIKEYAESNGESWREEEVLLDQELEQKYGTTKPSPPNPSNNNNPKPETNGTNTEVNGAKKQAKTKSGEPTVEPEMDESSIDTVKQCRRPWWVVQPYVRPLPKEALMKGSLTLSKKERAAIEGCKRIEKCVVVVEEDGEGGSGMGEGVGNREGNEVGESEVVGKRGKEEGVDLDAKEGMWFVRTCG